MMMNQNKTSSINSVNSGKSHGDNPEPSSRRGTGAETSSVTIKELAYATLLGDGYITPGKYKRKNGTISDCNSWLVFAQSNKHKQYVDWMAKLFSKHWKIKKFKRQVGCGYNDKKYIQYGFRTNATPYFTHLRKNVFYPNGKKRITQKILSQVTPLGLAIWWMDDGSLSSQHSFVLCTDTYTLKEVKMISDWFYNNWGIKWNITKNKRLQCNTREGIKLIKVIKKNIIPSMYYKVFPKYKNLNCCKYKAELFELLPEQKR